jgi:hypothetical protein
VREISIHVLIKQTFLEYGVFMEVQGAGKEVCLTKREEWKPGISTHVAHK